MAESPDQPFDLRQTKDGDFLMAAPDGSWRNLVPSDGTSTKIDATKAKQIRDGLQADPKALAAFMGAPQRQQAIQTAPTPAGAPPSTTEQNYQAQQRVLAQPQQQAVTLPTNPVQPPGYVEQAKQGAIDYLRSKQADKSAAVANMVLPGSNTELATLLATLTPGMGEAAITAKLTPMLGKYAPTFARLLANASQSKVLLPAGVGGVVGGLSDEGAGQGVVKGLLQGLGNKFGQWGNMKYSGVGQKTFKLTEDQLSRYGTDLAPGAAKALGDSMPILREAKVPLKTGADLQQLLSPTVRKQVGKVFDKVEDEIRTAVGNDTVDMPVMFTTTESSGSTGVSRASSSAGTASRTAETTSKANTDTDTIIQANKQKMPSGATVSRVRTQPGSNPGRATTSTTEATTTAKGRTESASQAESSSTRKTLTDTSFDTKPMGIQEAIDKLRGYRLAAADGDLEDKRLYYEAAGKIFDKIKDHDHTLAQRWQDVNEEYHRFMSFREAFTGKDAFLGGSASGGFNPLTFATEMQKHPHLLDSTSFGPVHDWMRGGAGIGAAPAKTAHTPFGGYFHLRELPFSQHFGQRGVEAAANLPPAMARVLEKHPLAGRVGQYAAPVATGVPAQHPGDTMNSIMELISRLQ